ncbi:uncharacterized protein LOC106666377 [Cimex lectularius]|uniref:Uncharacterized protein n=1 Tax=Cimex lectularius TaxID=79782 RepID=A0A8I6RRY0_CIMLE|nr:uncharacterized protein LOC106666377 [Cimex lectularius]
MEDKENQNTRTKDDEELGNEGVETLEEARKMIRELRERHRHQSLQLLAWRRRYKAQEDHIARVNLERNEQLRKLSMQLMLFESRLCRKQRDIGVLLSQREGIITRQQKAIKQLQSRLADAGVELNEETNLDSLNDSDSAVIMEDDDLAMPCPNGVRIIRSVSDALETTNSNKYSMLRRSNCLLRRPEILETVYSVEEDGDGDAPAPQQQPDPPPPPEKRTPKLKDLSGSFERLDHGPPPHLTTYNRVMSNHRSVTKPKDVKYKRINKAKSKSLEELRGRLKNWVDKGSKIAVSLDQSLA